eukprot:9246274-Pyramimonas_sp.AAC.1
MHIQDDPMGGVGRGCLRSARIIVFAPPPFIPAIASPAIWTPPLVSVGLVDQCDGQWDSGSGSDNDSVSDGDGDDDSGRGSNSDGDSYTVTMWLSKSP